MHKWINILHQGMRQILLVSLHKQMDITIVLILTPLALYKCAFTKTDNDLYLSLEQTKCLKGLFAMIVLFHHISHYVDCASLYRGFGNAGYLSVAFFFFISGYGLVYQYEKRPTHYLLKFPSSKFRKVILPYWLISAIYLIYDNLTGSQIRLYELIYRPFTRFYLANNCWYIVALIYYYLVFYFAILIVSSKSTIKGQNIICAVTLLYLAAYFAFYYSHSYIGIHWATSITALPAGVFYYYFEGALRPHLTMIATSAGIVMLGLFAYRLINHTRYGIALSNLNAICFIALILFFSAHVLLKSPILSYLGELSFEIYLVQGLILRSMQRSVLVNHFVLFTVIAVAATIMTAITYKTILHGVGK